MEIEKPHQGELRLLMDLKPIVKFLDLSTMLSILFLNKKMKFALSDSPYIFLFILQHYFLRIENVHPNIRRGFEDLLLNKIKLNFNEMTEAEQEVYASAIERTILNKNLLPDDLTAYSLSKIKITRNGGDGWRFEEVSNNPLNPSPRILYKSCLATSYGDCEIVYFVKFESFSLKLLEDFKAGKAVIKVGCFIARRYDCNSRGGMKVKILDENTQVVFEKNIHQASESLPISPEFKEISVTITSDDIPTSNKIENYSIEFKIYGRDDRFWKGWYGSKFCEMYIHGDFFPKAEE